MESKFMCNIEACEASEALRHYVWLETVILCGYRYSHPNEAL